MEDDLTSDQTGDTSDPTAEPTATGALVLADTPWRFPTRVAAGVGPGEGTGSVVTGGGPDHSVTGASVTGASVIGDGGPGDSGASVGGPGAGGAGAGDPGAGGVPGGTGGGGGDGGSGEEPPGDGTGSSGAAAGAAPPRRLRRDTQHRMLGGVAAGVAHYLDIDVVIVRVAFAVLTVFGGTGILIYLAAWLLIPADDEEHPLAQQWAGRRPPRRSLVVIVLGIVVAIIALSDLFSSGPWWPHRDGGFGLAFGAVALVLAATLVLGSGGNRSAASRVRWLLLMVLLTFVAIVVVAAATVFSIEAASGVPLRGGVGDTQFHPTTAAALAPNYRLAVGNLNVDLSAVPFRAGTTHITASVGIGHLSVEVPPGPSVSVVAHSGLGDVRVFGQNNGGLSTVQTMQSGGAGSQSNRHVVITADAGVGQVDVERTSPAFS